MSDQEVFATYVRRNLAASYRIEEARIGRGIDRMEIPLPERVAGFVRGGDPDALPPIAPDLESFAYADVEPDPRIPGRLIEFNLEECNRLLSICLVTRRDYCDLARQHVDVTLRSEEFLLTDAVHEKEVGADLYKQPSLEATHLEAGLDASRKALDQQRKEINALLNDGAMSPSRIEENANHAAKLIEYQMGRVHPDAMPTQKEMSQYRSALDSASWNHSQKAAESAYQIADSQLNAISEKKRYANLDVAFRTLRRQISQQTAYQQLAENCRPGSPVNYSERLAFLKDTFTDSLKALSQRTLSLQAHCEAIYGVKLDPVTHRKGQLLDALCTWVMNAQTVLSSRFRRERVESYTIWLAKGQEIDDATADRTWRFDLSEKMTGNRQGIIRSVSIEQFGDHARSVELDLTPPEAAIERIGGRRMGSLHCGRIMRQGSGEQPGPLHLELLWNGDPYGLWRLSLPRDQGGAAIDALAVHLRLAFP
jgi:hypothetical protein